MRLKLDPLAPNGVSVAPDTQIRTVTNAVPRLQTLDDLQDVIVNSTPTDNQALAYDTATSKWIPQTIAGGGGGGAWGTVTGTLSDQADLKTELDGKLDETDGITTLSLADASTFGGGLMIETDASVGGSGQLVAATEMYISAHTDTDGSGTWSPSVQMSGSGGLNFQALNNTNNNITFQAGDNIGFTNGVGGYYAYIDSSALTANRDFVFPDTSGTLATQEYTQTNAKGWVNHGATAGTSRTPGFSSIEWYGSVEPTNAIAGDTWINSS